MQRWDPAISAFLAQTTRNHPTPAKPARTELTPEPNDSTDRGDNERLHFTSPYLRFVMKQK